LKDQDRYVDNLDPQTRQLPYEAGQVQNNLSSCKWADTGVTDYCG